FNLGCQDWKRSLVGTVHNAGFFISIPLTGLISDRYGRRLALVFASVANGIFGVIRAFSLNYEMFIVLEFLEPALGGGVYTACFVLGSVLNKDLHGKHNLNSSMGTYHDYLWDCRFFDPVAWILAPTPPLFLIKVGFVTGIL
ncbi:jg24185, partial [Pararge aegeria aegeria]